MHLDELVAGVEITLGETDIYAIEHILLIGWCHGDRSAEGQWLCPEKYC